MFREQIPASHTQGTDRVHTGYTQGTDCKALFNLDTIFARCNAHMQRMLLFVFSGNQNFDCYKVITKKINILEILT